MTRKELLAFNKQRRARFAKVRRLRDSGMKWKEVAKAMGVSMARVSVMYMYGDNDIPETIKQEVREAYGGRCALCTSQENIHIHHINGPQHILSNLIALCGKCHRYVHRVKRENLEEYGAIINRIKI